ncbi:MAG: beta-lactamase family protein [Lachnospiraceae bacterium]|nr:beta-lactamase family protein [Lachnospiraceae bacterium]
MKYLERADALSMGVNPGRLALLYKEVGKKNVHSMMITRHNKVIAEGWWSPYKAEYNHIQYSVSKSFVGTAIGIAVTKGLLNINAFVLDILKNVLPYEPCQNMRKLRVRDVLTMSTGHKDERNMFSSGESWIYSLLSSYVDNPPGKQFRYISSSTYILSAIIKELTGKNVFDFLQENLFIPMGFSDSIWWETSPEGLNTAFNGLNATAEDITKLALLYLNKGVWNGKRILSEEWVAQASSVQINNSDNGDNQKLGYRQGFGTFTDDWKSGYGFLFWHCRPEGVYRGDGIFGQMCIVMPKQDMTVAIAAGHAEPSEILEIVWEHLLPAIDDTEVSEADSILLKETLQTLSIPVVSGTKSHPLQQIWSGRSYIMAPTGAGIEKLMLQFNENSSSEISITTAKGELKILIGYNEWITSETEYDADGFSCDNVIFFGQVACCGAWQGDEYIIKLVYTRTPFIDTLRIRFEDAIVLGKYSHTVKYGRQGYDLLGIQKTE